MKAEKRRFKRSAFGKIIFPGIAILVMLFAVQPLFSADTVKNSQGSDALTQEKSEASSVEKATPAAEDSSSLIQIENEEDFNSRILKSDKPVLVDFYADWCGPCRMLAPTIKKLAAEFSGKAVVAKLNVDNLKSLAQKFQIRGIPCVILFKNGKEVDRIVGLRQFDFYKGSLDKLLK